MIEFEEVSLYDIAKKTNYESKSKNKDKIKLDDLMAQYPNGVTINGAYYISNTKFNPFWIFTFEEDKTKCFSAGGDLKKIASDWLEHCENNFVLLNEHLAKSPIKFKIYKKKLKRGYFYTVAEAL